MSYEELRERVNDLRKQADSCGACDGNGSWREYGCKIMCACCEGIREELESLEDQLAIERNAELERNRPPEPAWTSEPPTEPGYFWLKMGHIPSPEIVEVWRDHESGALFFDRMGQSLDRGFAMISDCDCIMCDHLWWSQKITIPPEHDMQACVRCSTPVTEPVR